MTMGSLLIYCSNFPGENTFFCEQSFQAEGMDISFSVARIKIFSRNFECQQHMAFSLTLSVEDSMCMAQWTSRYGNLATIKAFGQYPCKLVRRYGPNKNRKSNLRFQRT